MPLACSFHSLALIFRSQIFFLGGPWRSRADLRHKSEWEVGALERHLSFLPELSAEFLGNLCLHTHSLGEISVQFKMLNPEGIKTKMG